MLLFFLLCLSSDAIDLSKLEMYSDNGYSACRQDGNLIIVSRGDHRIVKIDPSGKTIAVFAQHGKGPYELESPTIVGANNKEVVILNRAREFLFLTPDLKVIKDKVYKVPGSEMLVQGVLLRDNIVAAVVRGMSVSHCIKLFKIEEKTLTLHASYRETSGDYRQKETFELGGLDNSNFFVFKPYLDQVTDYEVQVFKYDHANEEMVQVLKSDFGSIKKKNRHYFIGHVVHTKKGYLVSLDQAANQQKEETYIDHFNKKGGFVRRETTNSNIYLVPVINSDEDLKVDLDSLKATFIE